MTRRNGHAAKTRSRIPEEAQPRELELNDAQCQLLRQHYAAVEAVQEKLTAAISGIMASNGILTANVQGVDLEKKVLVYQVPASV